MTGARQASAPWRKARKLAEEGVALARAGRLDRALDRFRAAAESAPALPRVNLLIGNVFARQGRTEDAIAAFRRELEIDPLSAAATAEIGTCLARAGRTADGIPFLVQALALDPTLPNAALSLGLALSEERRFAEVARVLDRLLGTEGSDPAALRARAHARMRLGRLDAAFADIRRLGEDAPGDPSAALELGLAAQQLNLGDFAEKLLRHAVMLAPADALAFCRLAWILINNRRCAEAAEAIARALELDPDLAESHSVASYIALETGRVEAALEAIDRAAALDPAKAEYGTMRLFALQHRVGITNAALFDAHRDWARRHAGEARPHAGFANDPDPTRRPRIGIVSAHLYRNAVAALTLRAIEQLALDGFPIVAFSLVRVPDDHTARFRAASVAWHDVSGRDDSAILALIERERIDVLIDLDGHIGGNRLSLFARRAAPVQVEWAGYVGTTGLETFEALISDPVETPPEHDGFYTEPVIRLPDGFVCYAPPDAAPAAGTLPSRDTGRFTFGCFNRPSKLNAPLGRAWAAILKRVPESRLLLARGGFGEPAMQAAVTGILGEGGVPPERLVFVEARQQRELLAAYGSVDLALDPFPYSGCLTSLEALWMGVPVVTLMGETFAGRHTASHLHALGLDGFCADTVDAYVAAAVDWTRRPDELGTLRAGLRGRFEASPLVDAPRFAGHLGAALTALWRDWCATRA